MSWTPLLLSDPSPCLRWLVLRQLFQYPEDHPEVMELAGLRESDPCWKISRFESVAPGAFALPKDEPEQSHLSTTSHRPPGILGFDLPCGSEKGAYLSEQREDGGWPLPVEVKLSEEGEKISSREGYSLMPLQTAFPLRGLAACGYAADPRAEKAYEWLLKQRLEDGAWPTGIASGVFGYVAGYRRIAHSRWGCRSNTTGALICLALHPKRRHSAEAQRAGPALR
jgi:hypothetical protein